MSHLDLDELRLLLSQAHEPQKTGFVRSIVLRVKNKFSRPLAQRVVMPLRRKDNDTDTKAA